MHVYIYTYMTKVISISDKAYNRLRMLKGKKESFTDVVLKMTDKEMKNSILDLAGAWEDNKEEMTRIFAEIKKEREAIKSREVNL